MAGCVLAVTLGGCAFLHRDHLPASSLGQRIMPPFEVVADARLAPPEASPPGEEELPAPRHLPRFETSESLEPVDYQPESPTAGPPLTLEQAINMSLSASPTIEAMRERVAQAEGGRQIAFAEFLPQSKVMYRNIAGAGDPREFVLPTIPTYVGNLAFGGASDHFSLAELNVQWTLWDFGRTCGRYGQAVSQVEIARLQFERAKETVAYNVAAAYFQVLQARASAAVAREAIRRAESFLRDSRNYLKRGAGIRNNVLRAEVFLAEMRLSLVKSQSAEGIAIAALNQAIGINVSTPTHVADRALEPADTPPLASCLQLAVDNRDEFGVVLRAIRSAQLGTGVAQAEYLPRVYVGGVGAHQDIPRLPNANLIAGGVNIELSLFEGGRRRGKLQAAEADVRYAVAQGKEICDRIAYEVHSAYLLIDNARQQNALSRTAVSQATENLRVVRSLFENGDATPTEVVDAELAMTRAQQDRFTAIYEYQVSLARLAYAAGVPVLTDFGVRDESARLPSPSGRSVHGERGGFDNE